MDGIHDLGGMHGFGSVEYDPDGPTFHHEWERRAFVSFVATLGQGFYNMDEVRHSIERMNPAEYLSARYYEKWLTGLETLLIEKGVLTPEQLADRVAAFEAGKTEVPERSDPELAAKLRAGVAAAYENEATPQEPRFEPGDAVVVRDVHSDGHTRCPRYVRGKRGTVVGVRGTFTLPDANAHGEASAAPVYDVEFDRAELWGNGNGDDRFRIDLWEPYLAEP
jgi:nitrile hydratase